MPKRSRKGRADQSRARSGADQGERRQVDADGPRRRPLADDEIELEVLHGRIKDFLDGGTEPVHLVDEQYVLRLQVGEDGGQVPHLGDDRTRGGAETHPQFAGDDLRKGRLAQSWRTVEEDVIEGLAAGAGGRDEYVQVFARLPLADEFVEAEGPESGFRAVAGDVLGRGDAILRHPPCSLGANSLSPARISASASASGPSRRAAWDTAPRDWVGL